MLKKMDHHDLQKNLVNSTLKKIIDRAKKLAVKAARDSNKNKTKKTGEITKDY